MFVCMWSYCLWCHSTIAKGMEQLSQYTASSRQYNSNMSLYECEFVCLVSMIEQHHAKMLFVALIYNL